MCFSSCTVSMDSDPSLLAHRARHEYWHNLDEKRMKSISATVVPEFPAPFQYLATLSFPTVWLFSLMTMSMFRCLGCCRSAFKDAIQVTHELRAETLAELQLHKLQFGYKVHSIQVEQGEPQSCSVIK